MRKDMVWFMLLVSIFLLYVVSLHGQKRYEKRVEHRIRSAVTRINRFRGVSSNAPGDDIYITRGELDVIICAERLQAYRIGKLTKASLDEDLKQLDRDMEDYPPQEAKR